MEENQERYFYFTCWSILWIIILNIGGSKEIVSSYRLNFIHGLLSSVVAILCLMNYIPYTATTTCTLSYFIIDFINIVLNDFIYQVPSYHTPMNRRVEYFHHIFCCFLGTLSEFQYKNFCTFEKNPFVQLMFAEFSTPFLIGWRITKSKILGGLFVITFFGSRLIYHLFFLIPECMTRCHWSVGYGFGIAYDLLNLFFFWGIVNKLRKSNKSKKTQ